MTGQWTEEAGRDSIPVPYVLVLVGTRDMVQGELPDLASEVTMAVLWPCSGWSSPSCLVLTWVSACRARGVSKERRAPWASLVHVALVGRRYEVGQPLCWGMLGHHAPQLP